jgi:hypothetical protein
MGMPAPNAEKRCAAAGAETGVDVATGNKVRLTGVDVATGDKVRLTGVDGATGNKVRLTGLSVSTSMWMG